MSSHAVHARDYWKYLLFIFSFVVILGSGYLSRWDASLIDFWGIWFYGTNLDVYDARSLFNGFFPIGYAIILRLVTTHYVVLGAYVINAFAFYCLVRVSYYFARMYNKTSIAAVVVMVSCLFPDLILSATAIGPDLLTAALVSLSTVFLWKCIVESGRGSDVPKLNCVCSGLFLGLSVLVRQHSVIFLPIFLLVYLLIANANLKRILLFSAVALSVIMINVIVNVFAGHSPLETAQNFNVYKLIYGVDVYNPPSSVPDSILRMILSAPKMFFINYTKCLSAIIPLGIPALIGYIMLECKHKRTICKMSALCIVLYALPVSLGGSPRAWIALTVFIMTPLSLVLSDLVEKWRNRSVAPVKDYYVSTLTTSFIVFVLFVNLIKPIVGQITLRRTHMAEYDFIRDVLYKNKLNDSQEVFTDDFGLYFDHSKSVLPRRNGSWLRFSTWKYANMYPQYGLSSINLIHQSFRSSGVKFLVLSSNCKTLSPALEEVYQIRSPIVKRGFVLLGDIGAYKIFEVR